MQTRTKPRGRRKALDPDLLLVKRQLASALREKIEADRISLSALARRLGTGRTALRRVLDERNTSCTLKTMFVTATGLGLRLRLVAEPLPAEQLMGIAAKMVDADNHKDAARLEREFIKGFYGDAPSSTREHSSGAAAAPAATGPRARRPRKR